MAEGDTALVLEGGGYRGQFTAGVLDVFLERGLADSFASVFGTSAGAINAVNFRSRQAGRYMRDTLAFRDDRRFMSVHSLVTTGNITGNDFLYHEVQDDIDPFDYETFNTGRQRVWVVVSDVVFGTANYLELSHLPEDIDKVRASASMPVISEMVEIDGHRYLDGGTTDAVAVEVALGDEGAARPEGYVPAQKAVVVLTQDRTYRKTKPTDLMPLAERRYADYHYFLTALKRRPEFYNRQRDRIFELESEGKVRVICPPEPVDIATTEHSGEKLLKLYLEGRHEAERHLDELRAFIE